jgi:cephalosporin hydroxylase
VNDSTPAPAAPAPSATGAVPPDEAEHCDDRQEFMSRARESARRMAADADLRGTALDLVSASDRYDWSYQWTWLGLPIIQMPPDVVALQEIIWQRRPQVIVETGVARGGSLVLSASILQLLGEGMVIGVELALRAHNRAALLEHPLAHRMRLVDGSSTDPAVVAAVRAHIGDAERVMVVLDSDHTHAHVLAELELYASMVTPGQELIVADTGVEVIPPQLRTRAWGPGDNPATALAAWLPDHPEFVVDEAICDKLLLTSSPGGYLCRT